MYIYYIENNATINIEGSAVEFSNSLELQAMNVIINTTLNVNSTTRIYSDLDCSIGGLKIYNVGNLTIRNGGLMIQGGEIEIDHAQVLDVGTGAIYLEEYCSSGSSITMGGNALLLFFFPRPIHICVF